MKKPKTLHFCIICKRRFLSAHWAIYCPKCLIWCKTADELLPKDSEYVADDIDDPLWEIPGSDSARKN